MNDILLVQQIVNNQRSKYLKEYSECGRDDVETKIWYEGKASAMDDLIKSLKSHKVWINETPDNTVYSGKQGGDINVRL